jgi:hypothetical protein
MSLRRSVDVLACTVGHFRFREYVPTEHIGQIIHQILVLSVDYVIYVSAAEIGVLYILVVQFSETNRQLWTRALRRGAETVVSWAHVGDAPPPLCRPGIPAHHSGAPAFLAHDKQACQGKGRLPTAEAF